MKSATLENGKIEIIDLPKPLLAGKKGAIIKVKGCGLCGSDIVKINHADKKAILGHEIVGEIVELNTEIVGNGANIPFKTGDIVAMGHHYPCMNCKFCKKGNFSMCATFKRVNIAPGGFSEFIFADEGHLKNTVFIKPKHITEEEFSFLEPLACCIRAVRRAEITEGLNILVIGLGSIGILMAQAVKAFNHKVFGLDINPDRQNFALKFDIKFDSNLKYDIIFMTSGSEKAINTAISLAEAGAKIIVFSSIPNDEGYKNNDIYYKELEIIGSYSPAPVDLLQSSRFISDKKVLVKGLLAEYNLFELNKAIQDTKAGKILKAYIKI